MMKAIPIIVFIGAVFVLWAELSLTPPKKWHGTAHIAYPFATGTTILDEWSHRQRVVAIGGCNDPIPQLNLRAFEGE